MIRRVLLSAALAAAAFAQQPAHADDICMLTVTFDGPAINRTVQVVPCQPYNGNQICTGTTIGPVFHQQVRYDLCLPDPQFV